MRLKKRIEDFKKANIKKLNNFLNNKEKEEEENEIVKEKAKPSININCIKKDNKVTNFFNTVKEKAKNNTNLFKSKTNKESDNKAVENVKKSKLSGVLNVFNKKSKSNNESVAIENAKKSFLSEKDKKAIKYVGIGWGVVLSLLVIISAASPNTEKHKSDKYEYANKPVITSTTNDNSSTKTKSTEQKENNESKEKETETTVQEKVEEPVVETTETNNEETNATNDETGYYNDGNDNYTEPSPDYGYVDPTPAPVEEPSYYEPVYPEYTEQTVYITNTGKKYHNSGCRTLKDSCIPISLTDAINQGYTPCQICH